MMTLLKHTDFNELALKWLWRDLISQRSRLLDIYPSARCISYCVSYIHNDIRNHHKIMMYLE